MIYTTSYQKARKLQIPYEDLIAVESITPMDFRGQKLMEFVPPNSLLNKYKEPTEKNREAFALEYLQMLDKLDPLYFGSLLQGKTIVSSHYADKTCHRRLITQWLRFYGFACLEL